MPIPLPKFFFSSVMFLLTPIFFKRIFFSFLFLPSHPVLITHLNKQNCFCCCCFYIPSHHTFFCNIKCVIDKWDFRFSKFSTIQTKNENKNIHTHIHTHSTWCHSKHFKSSMFVQKKTTEEPSKIMYENLWKKKKMKKFPIEINSCKQQKTEEEEEEENSLNSMPTEKCPLSGCFQVFFFHQFYLVDLVLSGSLLLSPSSSSSLNFSCYYIIYETGKKKPDRILNINVYHYPL